MTLLITVLTPDYIVQASDRKLTFLDGTTKEDVANKATLLCRIASFSFTGLADMSAVEKTHILLLRSLGIANPKGFEAAVENLRTNATDSVKKIRIPVRPSQRRRIIRTSFVGAGFVQTRSSPDERPEPNVDALQPLLTVVSNSQDLSETWRAEADPAFSTHYKLFRRKDLSLHLHVAGQAISSEERVELLRGVRRCQESHAAPTAAARLLARTVQAVARRNPLVGSNVMCTIINRENVLDEISPIASPMMPIVPQNRNEAGIFHQPTDRPPLWIYLPDDFSDMIHYSPNFACNGIEVSGMLFGHEDRVQAVVKTIDKIPPRS